MIQCCITAGCPRRSDEGQAHWPVTRVRVLSIATHGLAIAGSICNKGFLDGSFAWNRPPRHPPPPPPSPPPPVTFVVLLRPQRF